MAARCVLVALLAVVATVSAIDNGLGLTPPMGWRSWNCYGGNIDQTKMQATMDAMASRARQVDGRPTSLKDLGFVACGLDDNWQACGKGVDNSFHDQNGYPIINTDRFPDMKAMTTYGHNLGLRVGWYMNNCICSEHSFSGDMVTKVMQQSVKAIADYGFDGVKLDGCSQFENLTWWAELINATGRHILIENCHWGRTTPNGTQLTSGPSQGDGVCSGTTTPSNCPYNFFRTSGDIRNTWKSMFGNLQTTRKFQGNPPLARPGTWAYPDMLEVGRMPSVEEDRTHFGAWVIVSAPLILGFDLTDNATMDKVWDIISNTEAIAINQAWEGHPGKVIQESDNYQVWAKPVKGGTAVLVINTADVGSTTVEIDLAGAGITGSRKVRDVWNHKDIGTASGKFTTDKISSHDSRLYRFDSN